MNTLVICWPYLVAFLAVSFGSAMLLARFCRNGWGPREPDVMPLEPGHQLYPTTLPEVATRRRAVEFEAQPALVLAPVVRTELAEEESEEEDDTQPWPSMPPPLPARKVSA